MIEVSGLTKRFNGAAAVDDVSFTVAEGEVLALVGTSGCGKSTTLKMINRLVEPTEGRITLDGRDTAAMRLEELRLGIGYVIQAIGLFPHWTVARNVATVPRLLALGTRPDRPARDRAPRALRPRSGRVRRQVSGRALGRAAAEGGRRQGDGRRAGRHPDGRAVRSARPDHPAPGSRRSSPPSSGGGA